MVLIEMLSNATDLEKYYRVTNILCSLKNKFDVESNNISVLRVLEKLHLMEIEFFNKYRKKGAAFILLERLAEIEPSTHISKLMIHVLRQWLIRSTDLILKDDWIFVRHLMNIIFKIRKKCHNMMYICEPMIVLILNSQLNSNQRHEIGECFNRICNNLTRDQRLSVQPNLVKHFSDIAAMIGPCGHFPCQYSLLEILIRWLLGRNKPEVRRKVANVWFPANRFSTRAKQIFLECTWDNFALDARAFLNAVNHDEKSVISVQITKVEMGDDVIIRSAWWLDINISTRSVSMMVPRKKLPLIREPAESYSVAFSLYADDTDNVTLQRIGNQNIVTMSSINSIMLSPTQKTTAWKTMIVSVTRQYVEILDKSLKQIFANKYKALISIEKGNPSAGETTYYHSESDFSRFSDPEKQNSSFAAPNKFATPHYSSEKVFSHTKPIATVVKTTEAPTMSNFDRKILGESNQAKSEVTVGSQNDFNETKFDKLLKVTVMCENIGDVRKRDTPSLTLPNSVAELLSPLNDMHFKKEDSKNLGIQGKFDKETVERFFERNFTQSNLKGRPVTVDETSSEDLESVVLDEKQDVETKIIPEIPYCSNNEVINIDTNESITIHPEKKSLVEPKLTTLDQISNKKLMENDISDEDITMKLNDKFREILSDKQNQSTLKKIWENENIDKQGTIENESIKLKNKDEETSLLKDKPKILKKPSVHKTITKNKFSSPRLILNPLELKRLPRKSVSRKPKYQFSDLLKISDNVAKKVSVNNNDDKFDVYNFSYVNEILEQPQDEALLTKREKRHRTPAKFKTKGKTSKRNNKEISKTTLKRNTKASTNLRDEIMRGASAVQLKDSELVKVDTADKIDELEPALVKILHMEIIAKNVAQENEKELSANRVLRKRTKKIKETIAEDNEQDISPFKKVRNYTKKIKDIKKADRKTPLSQLATQIVENNTRDNENVNDISSDVIRNENNYSLNKIEVYNDSSNRNESKNVNVRMPKENDVDALSVHDSSSSLTLKTIVTSSTIKRLNKTYEPRNLEYEYLKPRQRDSVNDLLSSIDHQGNECYEPKRSDALKTKAIVLRYSVERTSSKNISRESSLTKTATNKKPLAKSKSKPVPIVCLERISSEKITRILSESCYNSIRENPESNRNSKVGAIVTLEARAIIERSPIIGNKAAHNKKRILETLASVRPLVENTAQNKNRKLETPASERPLVENTAQNKNRKLETPASERPLVENTAQNKNRKLKTPASERPLVENTAQNKNRKLETPARSPNRKFLKNNCGRRLASRRESSVSEWINKVDPRPKVPLSERIEDIKEIFLEKIDTLKEIQIGNTRRLGKCPNTLNMCVDMSKKLDEVFETQRKFHEQTMDDLGKHFSDLLKRAKHRATERWREAFNGLHNELKTKSQKLLEEDVSSRVEFITLLREEIDNI